MSQLLPGPAVEIARVNVSSVTGARSKHNHEDLIVIAAGGRDEARAGLGCRPGLEALITRGLQQSIGIPPHDITAVSAGSSHGTAELTRADVLA